MHINITASETGGNKGSSGALVHYLEKENRLSPENDQHLSPEYWFNGSHEDILRQEVRSKIDNNIAKLGKEDAKFFLINISPSQKELSHLVAQYGEVGAKEKLKEFAVKVMDEYALNFKRPGINSHKDLLWFGKLENYRYYSHKDEAVKQGLKNTGDRKEGRQMHVQVIVSRKDMTNKIKLSPQNNSKGTNKAHSAKLGQFDRMAFKQSGERLFDQEFNFDRGLKDTLAYANTMKNGTAMQKAQMQVLDTMSGHRVEGLPYVVGQLSQGVAEGLFADIGQMIGTAGKAAGALFELLMTEVPQAAPQVSPAEEMQKRKKKKKGQSQSVTISR
ncbi:hypothetical protein SAMN05216464_11138 [Mucilaginibacter pineti]|uniref:Molybdopterin-guanine dinucleotide biosynthesis protein MobB n=1 Tax=Mucilaginibacter pineti TaxID=1391627 RepID=A0A1G7H359_9SPHI|nr:DUF5712 family protein [Mucilaginibacter pineti]SDE94846.1 hypothetical protein SAMN05216464_11138 [Mucilaginibacter pineti]